MQTTKYTKRIFTVFLGTFLTIPASTVYAQVETSFSKWLEKISVKGDLRLRHETINRNAGTKKDRHRQRFRLRISANFALPHDMKVKTRFASGTGEQTSTNQSFDEFSDQKGIWIDRAFLVWTPMDGMITVQGGKMSIPFWRTYSSDIIWDRDFNPEGFAQKFNVKVGDSAKVFLNALQMVSDEESSVEQDQFLFAEQVGAEIKIMGTQVTIAGAFYEWVNEDVGTIVGATGTGSEGNREPVTFTSGLMPTRNQFGVGELTVEVKSEVGPLPIKVDGSFIRNFKHFDENAITDKTKADSGYQFGIAVGKAKKRNTFEVAAYKKWVEADATVDHMADSDFGDAGGTNREGYHFWIAYSPLDWMKVKVKHFTNETLDKNITGSIGVDPIQRTQVDISVKF